jgi:AcrR family transcriptional regulator
MKSTADREIIGRRHRPAKAPLSRDAIISMALSILEKDGLSGLSLRRVATALDTGAASLYVYLANLDELYALMLDRALAAVELPEGHDRPWRDRLKAYLMSYLHVLRQRQGLAHLAMSTVATGVNSLRMWEVLLGLLKEGGIGEASLVAGVDMLLLHVTSIAAEEANQRATGQDFDRIRNALAGASDEQFPLVSALFKEGMFFGGADDDAHIRWVLDALVDGITARQVASSSQSTKKSSV